MTQQRKRGENKIGLRKYNSREFCAMPVKQIAQQYFLYISIDGNYNVQTPRRLFYCDMSFLLATQFCSQFSPSYITRHPKMKLEQELSL